MSGEDRAALETEKNAEQQSLVKQAIIEELREIMPLSVKYKSEMETAKTKTKEGLMRKRLTENNKKVAELLVALERLDKAKGNNNELYNSEGRVEETGNSE